MSQFSTWAIDPRHSTHCNYPGLIDSAISGRTANIRHQDTSFACQRLPLYKWLASQIRTINHIHKASYYSLFAL
jgi:hypothetical protein